MNEAKSHRFSREELLIGAEGLTKLSREKVAVIGLGGVGSYAVEALVVSDYAAVQGFVLSMAILFVILNLLVDISYTLIDPRIKLAS